MIVAKRGGGGKGERKRVGNRLLLSPPHLLQNIQTFFGTEGEGGRGRTNSGVGLGLQLLRCCCGCCCCRRQTPAPSSQHIFFSRNRREREEGRGKESVAPQSSVLHAHSGGKKALSLTHVL